MLRLVCRLALRSLVLGLLALPGAVVLDRLLARRRGAAAPAPMQMLVVIDAPIETVWRVVADIPAQPLWMHEMKEVRLDTPGPARPGTRGTALVRIAGISVWDPVEVVAVEPPHRFEIRHDGLFTGGGVITLEASADGRATVVHWAETLIPPLLPELGALAQAPILRSIFQADLLRLKRLVEHGGVE